MAYYETVPGAFKEEGWIEWDKEKPEKGEECEVGLLIEPLRKEDISMISGFDWTDSGWIFDGKDFCLEYEEVKTREDEDEEFAPYYDRTTYIRINSKISPDLKTDEYPGKIVWRKFK